MTPDPRASPWPAIGLEDQTWEPTQAGLMGRGARPFTYQSALPALISQRRPAVAPDTSLLAAEAEKELARFDAQQGHRIAEFAPVLLRSEAASSSQIENLTASARAILSAELGLRKSRNAELISGNTQALRAALELSDDVSADRVLEMHRVLMATEPRHAPGHWRTEAVWIGTRAESPSGAEFVAPDHSRIPELVSDLVSFSRRTDIPALQLVAISHAQFETIHPFTDGNGRTGRALAQSLLRFHDVTRNVAVPVSAGLLVDVGGYHQALTAYRRGELDPIVRAFSHASLRAVSNAQTLLTELEAIRSTWDDRLSVRRDSKAWPLLDVLLRRPVLNSATAASELGIKQPNVYPALKALVDCGILQSKKEHQLGPIWRSDEVLHALDAFAERAGRRSRS